MKKRLPSLSSNFATIINDGGFYVDKTQFIETLENFNQKILFFHRPRRFGKSLLLSMIEHYYGIHHKDKFQSLFSNYYIGKPGKTTPLCSRYYILNFNFSGIMTDSTDDIFASFSKEVSTQVNRFLRVYNLFDSARNYEILKDEGAIDILRNLFSSISSLVDKPKIFILIDEYDHFINELLAFKTDHFKSLVAQNGWVRKFYEVIKQYVGDGIIDRFFATGVTPVTLDSLTSGFNIAKNITLDAQFHNMAGFTEDEVRKLITGTIYEEGKFDLEQVVFDIRDWYNGSRFSVETNEKLYNPQLLVNFLTTFYYEGKYPSDMYDPSVASDYSKIRKQLSLLDIEESFSVITSIVQNENIREGITLQYNLEDRFIKTDLVSLLFYNGLLTIGGGEGKLIDYVIPNYVVKTMYWTFLQRTLVDYNTGTFHTDELISIFDEMRHKGKLTKLVEYISALMNSISNRDLRGFKESNLKMLFMPVLCFANIYKIYSDIEVNRKYIDIYLKLQPNYNGKYSFILELKYLKQDEFEKYDEIKQNGIEQLKNYLRLENLQADENLKAVLIIFRNNTGEIVEVV
ncbi:MAG: AAA family ATPase [Ignavibacteriaceae bacterium]|nr:AAA family ATPase [Ignavibacteriaceae bacterium]